MVDWLLLLERLAVGTDGGVFHLMAHQLQIVVIAKHAPIPLNSLAGTCHVACHNLSGYLAGQTCRTDDEALVILLQILAVGAGAHVVAIDPRTTHQFDKILIARIVLGQHDEVVAALVLLAVLLLLQSMAGDIHLTTEDGLEGFQALFLATFIDATHIVMKFFDTKHVAMVGDGHAAHAIAHGLVYQFLDARLTIKYRVICMYMKMYKIFHNAIISSF